MNRPNEKTVYELVSGIKAGGSLLETEPMGYAFRFGESRHYVVKPRSRFGKRYYIIKKPLSRFGYVVFAKVTRTKRGSRFRDEVGSATLSEDLKSHLEISVTGFDCPFFMNLYPLDL